MIWLERKARNWLFQRLKWDEEEFKWWRKHSLCSWFLPVKTERWTEGSTARRDDDHREEKWRKEPMCRCGCFQVEHGVRRTQGACGLGGGVGVAEDDWCCKDELWWGVGWRKLGGEGWLVFFGGSCTFLLKSEWHAELKGFDTAG